MGGGADEDATGPETRRREPAAPEVAPEAEPTDEAEQSEPEEPTDNNPEEGYGNGSDITQDAN